MAFAGVLGLKLDVLDVGWPMGAAVSFASPIAGALIPAVLVLNVILVAVNQTRTVDVDLWNYWHFIYTGARHPRRDRLDRGSASLGACVTAFVIFKLADWTAPAVEHHFGLEGSRSRTPRRSTGRRSCTRSIGSSATSPASRACTRTRRPFASAWAFSASRS